MIYNQNSDFSLRTPLSIDAHIVEKRETTQKKLAFLIQYCNIAKTHPSEVPLAVKACKIAGVNKIEKFDCIHVFDFLHISSLLRQLPIALHKRVALYVIRIFAGVSHVDDIIEIHLKPALREMIRSQCIYYEIPGWVNELYSENILDTWATLQAEVGGYDSMEAEYAQIKNLLLESSKQLSAVEFRRSLQDNPSIGKVYGVIDSLHLNFIDSESTIIYSTDHQRHLLFKLEDREVSVHLFGGNSKETDSYEELSRFAIKNGLKLPADVPERRQERFREYHFEKNIVQAFADFKSWIDNYHHFCEDSIELVNWLHECPSSEGMINTYTEFVQLAELARKNNFKLDQIPSEQVFNNALQIRGAKKIQHLENSSIFFYERALSDRLAKEKEIYNAWVETCEDDKSLDKKYSNSSGLFNIAINLFYSIQKRREKFIQESLPEPQAIVPLVYANSYARKIMESHSLCLLDFLSITNDPLPSVEYPKIIKKYLDLVELAQEALSKFNSQEMEYFDPLVGENSCQIRAAMFAEILNKSDIADQIKLAQVRLKEHSIQIKNLFSKTANFGKVEPIKTFLKQNNGLFSISEDLALIISSFILTKAKVIEFKPNQFGVPIRIEKINAKKLSEKTNFTTNFAVALIKLMQVRLSELSVLYVQRHSLQNILNQDEKAAGMLVYNHVKTDERNRKILPFYPAMRVLLKRMFKKKIPLVLRIEQFVKGQSESYGTLSLIFGKGNKGYILINNFPEASQRGVLLFQGKSIVEQKETPQSLSYRILKHEITDLILGASADHPQYGSDNSFHPDEPLFQHYRENAYRWGTCDQNPSLFRIEHVYCHSVEQNLIQVLPDTA